MNIRLHRLELKFLKADVSVPFADISYFHGQMGAGKSSIARLVDYCLGGKLEATPALQSEFLSAILHVSINDVLTEIRRDRDAHFAYVRTTLNKQLVELKVPVRSPNGEIIKGSGIEVLSDLVLALSGIRPPRVRKSKYDNSSELERLSLRDLLWFCYLDQDEFDSNFFHLGLDANIYKRNKSREVLRYILGFHQEAVSEYEQRLEYLRLEKHACETALVTLRDALIHAKIAPDFAWLDRRAELKEEQLITKAQITKLRQKHQGLRPHVVDELQHRARQLVNELESIRQAMGEMRASIEKDKSHVDELRSLSFRQKRATSARAVLGGVEFKNCPRCTLVLPSRSPDVCSVCGQPDHQSENTPEDSARLDRDVQDRVIDLEELIKRQSEELARLDRQEHELSGQKRHIDERLNQLLMEYDSAFLSEARELEREEGRIDEELRTLDRLGRLLQELSNLGIKLEKFKVEESELLPKLREARKIAESDLKNVTLLRELFLDCLVRSQIAGFNKDDQVEMLPTDFLPEVSSIREVAVSSFANMGSGGKKTLFKCCFALALHRVNARINGPLPSFMVIDSAMKNISERANQQQFESFHSLLYELATTELKQVQFVLIDKEMFAPPVAFSRSFEHRTMNPGDPQNPPLIPYYAMPEEDADTVVIYGS